MTLRIYADRKEMPLERVTVTLTHKKVHVEDCEECDGKGRTIDRIDRTIALEGALDAATRKQLMDIADKCPVHRTLKTANEIRTFAAEG